MVKDTSPCEFYSHHSFSQSFIDDDAEKTGKLLKWEFYVRQFPLGFFILSLCCRTSDRNIFLSFKSRIWSPLDYFLSFFRARVRKKSWLYNSKVVFFFFFFFCIYLSLTQTSRLHIHIHAFVWWDFVKRNVLNHQSIKYTHIKH